MPAQWDVEAALNEVVGAIRKGAIVLEMDGLTEKMVKDMYRDDFSNQTEESWNAHRAEILALARKAGRSSEIGTILKWTAGDGPVAGG